MEDCSFTGSIDREMEPFVVLAANFMDFCLVAFGIVVL